MGGLGQDRAQRRPIANPNIQRLKAVPEETQAMGGALKSPALLRSVFLAVNISLSPSVTDGTRLLRAGGWIEENKGGGKTRVLAFFAQAN